MSVQTWLQHIERALDIPYPAKREVLEELATHLEDLRDQQISEGVSPEVATRAALEALSTDELLSGLEQVHRTAIARALDTLPRAVALGIEHTTLAAVGAVLLGTILLKEAVMLQIILDGGFFMIPLNLAGLAILMLFGERLYSLFVKKDHRHENLFRRLDSLRFLGVLTALTGVLGTLVGGYIAFSRSAEIIARHGAFPIYDVAAIALTTAIWGISLTVVAEIGHFVVQAKAKRIDGLRLT